LCAFCNPKDVFNFSTKQSLGVGARLLMFLHSGKGVNSESTLLAEISAVDPPLFLTCCRMSTPGQHYALCTGGSVWLPHAFQQIIIFHNVSGTVLFHNVSGYIYNHQLKVTILLILTHFSLWKTKVA